MIARTWFVILAFTLALWLGSPVSAQNKSCGAPQSGVDDWPIDLESAAGFDTAELCALIDHLDAKRNNVHSVLIVRGG